MPNLSAPTALSGLPSSTLKITHHEGQDGWCVVEVDGEVDLASAPGLNAALADLLAGCGYRRFVIELSRVGHLDSSGLGVLVAFRTRLGAEGSLALANMQPSLRDVLRLTGVERAFEIWPSMDGRFAPNNG